MVTTLALLAQRGADSPANQWLNEHPLVFGILALLIGGALAGSGISELRKGVSRDKYGIVIKGGLGKVASILRVVIGAAFAAYGVYTMIAG